MSVYVVNIIYSNNLKNFEKVMTLSSNEVWDVIFLLLLARSTAQKLFRHLSSSSSSHNKFNNNAFYAHCVRTSLLLRNNNRLYNLLSRHKSLSLSVRSLATSAILLCTFEPVQDLVSAPAFFIMTARAYYLHLLIWLLNTLHIICATWQWEEVWDVPQPEFLLFTLCLQLEAFSYATLCFHSSGRLTQWPIWWSLMNMCDTHGVLKVKFIICIAKKLKFIEKWPLNLHFSKNTRLLCLLWL